MFATSLLFNVALVSDVNVSLFMRPVTVKVGLLNVVEPEYVPLTVIPIGALLIVTLPLV